jgi:hypothetical protein
MMPSKSKQSERSSHVHTASVAQATLAQESQFSNFAEVQPCTHLEYVEMVLTNKQMQALAAAAPHIKAGLRRMFNEQNSGKVPGRARDQKQRGGRQARRVNVANLNRMPRAYNHQKGQMPDMSRGHWDQTPASSNVLAPRGFGYYDAFQHDPFSVATHMSIGPATPIVGTTVVSENLVTKKPSVLTGTGPGTGLEGGAILLIVMPGTGDTQAIAYESSSALVTDIISTTNYLSPQLTSDQPDNAIPTRCSMRMRNWTQHVGVGGIVRILRMTTGVALNGNFTTNGELAQLVEGIRTHTRTRTYGGDELLDTHQKNCTVVDQSKATWFNDWDSVIPNSSLPWTDLVGWDQNAFIGPFTKQLHDPAYTPIAVLFEPFVAAVSGGSVGNKYEVSVRSQFLAHYTQGSMLANMAISAPTAPEALTKHRDSEESKGSVLEKIGNAISQGASWAWNHKADIIPAGYAAWKFMRPAVQGAAKVL